MQTIFVAATHTAETKARTGVQSVVRGLLHGLAGGDVDLRAVRWVPWRNRFSALKAADYARLELYVPNEPLPRDPAGSWLILPEVIYRSRNLRVIRHAHKQRMRVAAIIHDAIPVSHPELVRRQATKFHAEYMTALCDVDLVVATSDVVADQFRFFVQERHLQSPSVIVRRLAEEFLGTARSPTKSETHVPAKILCVSTLEPRKNHETLLQAFDLACAQTPLSLNLVGARYKKASGVVAIVNAAMAQNPDVKWHGRLTDAELLELYRECDFTIYPSFLEGFGLPIAESLWHRRPCICADFGAMAETAKGGGCVLIDVRDPVKICDAIIALATNGELRRTLIDEIENRPLKTWRDYAEEICEALAHV